MSDRNLIEVDPRCGIGRAFPKLAHTKRTCSSTHPDSRLRGNDGMRFSGQWKGPAA